MNTEIMLIAGDSWSAGIFDPKDEYGYHYGGISQRLVEHGIQVRNLSQPGGSNLHVLERIKNYLICNDFEVPQIKGIIFSQIEFFKDFYYYKPEQLKAEFKKGYRILREHWIYRPYHMLSELYQKWHIPVYIIGGSSDTVWYDEFEKDFPGVKIVCQSVTDYLINGSDKTSAPVYGEFVRGMCEEFLDAVKKNTPTEDLEYLMQDMDLGHKKLKLLTDHPELFYPDGIHPNQQAHDILFELLQKHVPELYKH